MRRIQVLPDPAGAVRALPYRAVSVRAPPYRPVSDRVFPYRAVAVRVGHVSGVVAVQVDKGASADRIDHGY